MKLITILCLLILTCFAVAHEGHQHREHVLSEVTPDGKTLETVENDRPANWMEWFGGLHLIFVHYPIALINMLALSEILGKIFKRPIFEFSSRFLLISAAILTPLTAILGLVYSYSSTYSGLMETYLEWHMWLGLATTLTVIALALMRYHESANRYYYATLLLLVLLVNLTAYFGGSMTFGPNHLALPIALT